MAGLGAAEHIEAHPGRPGVISNQAMMFCLHKSLNLPRHGALPSRLFEHL